MQTAQYNGRINIIGPNIEHRFAMSDSIPINSTSNLMREAMTGIWDKTPLSSAFFSSANMQILQNGIRSGVYAKSNNQYVIGEQSPSELGIIMRAIFLQKSKNLPTNLTAQISVLNNEVLLFAVKNVFGEAEGYMKYKRDASTISNPPPMPIMVSNSKQLELKKWF